MALEYSEFGHSVPRRNSMMTSGAYANERLSDPVEPMISSDDEAEMDPAESIQTPSTSPSLAVRT